jgi:hypothetical protein
MIAEATAKMLRGTAAPVLLAGVAVFLSLPAAADEIPQGAKTSNLEVVGFTGLNGRPGAFKLALKHTRTTSGTSMQATPSTRAGASSTSPIPRTRAM